MNITSTLSTHNDSFSNTSMYDVVCHYQAEHYFLVVFVLFSAVFGVIGNTFVFIATLYRKAFSGDNISIVFVRNLAIADILYIILQVIPDITARISGHEWVLGDAVCFISAHFVYMTGVANMAYIFTISLYRLLTCLFPLTFNLLISKKKANLFAAGVWVYSSIPSIVYLAFRGDVEYDEANTDCTLSFEQKTLVDMIIGPITIVLPFIGIIVFNIALLIIAYKSAQKLGRSGNQAFLTISAVSSLFIISWLPYITRKILGVLVESDLSWLKKIDIMFYQFSTFGNPVIYTMVNGRFRSWIKTSLFKCFAPKKKLTSYHSQHEPSVLTTTQSVLKFVRQLSTVSSSSSLVAVKKDSKQRVLPGLSEKAEVRGSLGSEQGGIISHTEGTDLKIDTCSEQ